MWKRDSGNWQERLKRSAQPVVVPSTPAPPPPPPVRSRFLADEFQERDSTLAFPNLQEAATAATAPCVLSPSTWVAFSGVDGGNVVHLREHLEAAVGRTVAHYVPLQGDGKVVYVCFETASDAHWMVRKSRLRLRWEAGAACTRAETLPTRQFTVEVDATWCTDHEFLSRYGNKVAIQASRSGSDAENMMSSVLADDVNAAASPGRAFQQRGSLHVLGLFYTRPENVVYQIIRFVALLTWIFFRGVVILFFSRQTSANELMDCWWRSRHGRDLQAASLRSSPLEYLTYWIAFRIPFSPPVSELDLLLWSWWGARCSQPQVALNELKRELKESSLTGRYGKRFVVNRKEMARHRDNGHSNEPMAFLPTVLTWNSSRGILSYSYLVAFMYLALVLWAII